MNARLAVALLRRPPAPLASRFLVEAIDRCDPTRSHESKPSARMRERRHARRAFRATFRALLAVVVLAALLSRLN